MHLIEERVVPREARRTPEILAVGGGKGGVGKTCFAVNLAIEIARKGWRVVLFDADLSCSNVETILGTRSERRLDDFFYQRGGKDLKSILSETQYENLRLIPGSTGLLDVANPKFQQKQALIKQLRELEADLIVVDLDAGAHLNTLDFFLMTDTHGVLVITPEKTSIDNAFKFLRAALFRRIERFYQSAEVGMVLKRNESLSDFLASVRNAEFFEEGLRQQIVGEIMAIANAIRPRIVVNRAHNAYEAQIAANILAKYARQYLLIEPSTLGFLYFDKCVLEAVNCGVPFVVSHPKQKISVCVSDIANRLGYL
ncbi:MAG: P-loop NTPase [Candidatus Hydrogenedentes bacterium]|nr:P-loop NTPase [Candidatus Hydrogenedentota bacterium]